MIVSAAVVFAIVGSALAFKAPYGAKFCASTTQDSGCTIITKTETTSSTDPVFYKDPNFNGTTCNSSVCGTQTHLIDEN